MIETDIIIERIRKRLDERRESMRSVSSRAGIGKDVLQDFLSGRSKIPAWDKLEAIRMALEMDPNFHSSERPALQEIAIVNGRDTILLHDEPRTIDAQMQAPPGVWDIVTIETDLLYPAYHQGEQLYLGPRTTDFNVLVDRDCLVCLNNGNVLLRKVAPESGGTTCTLTMPPQDPLLHCKLSWAQPVKWTRRN